MIRNQSLVYNENRTLKFNFFYLVILSVMILFSFLGFFKVIPLGIVRIINTVLILIFPILMLFFKKIRFVFDFFSVFLFNSVFTYFTEVFFLDNLFRINLVLSFFIFIYYLFMNKAEWENNNKELLKENMHLFLFLGFWFIYSFIALIWASDSSRVFVRIEFIFYALVISYLILYFYYKNQDSFPLIIFVILFLFLLIISILEIYTKLHLPSARVSGIKKPVSIPSATFWNQNDFATFLYIMFPFLAFFLLRSKKLVLKVLFLVSVLLMTFISIYKTDSKANLFGLIIFLCIFFLVLFIQRIIFQKKLVIKFCFLGILFALLFGSVFLIAQSKYYKTYISTVQKSMDRYNKKNKRAVDSLTVRINLIKNGFIMLKDSYFLGVGPGNLEGKMKLYSETHFYTKKQTNMHNFWMELLVDYGAVVFILFMVFYIAFILKTLGVIFRQQNLLDVLPAIVVLSSLIGFIVSSVSTSSLLTRPMVWIYFSGLLVLFKETEMKLLKGNAGKVDQ